jgi:transcriptional regulator with XRE-family HTH domain
VRSHVEALRETMSTREVAAAAGVSADTIAKVLRGGSVSAESAAKLVLVQPVEGGK